MKKNAFLKAGSILLLALFAFGFGGEPLMKDFVSFDRAFIPPLALTNQDKVNPSKKAMAFLKENWMVFKGKHYEANPKDPLWKKDLDSIEAIILKAAGITESGQNLMSAHEQLEEIRYLFMNARKRNGIDYYIDHLTVFHELMEGIIHTVSERDADTLKTNDKEYLAEECQTAIQVWEKIQKTPFDKTLFGFNDPKTAELQNLIKAEESSLLRLKKALDGNDKAEMIKAGKAIQPNYAQLYKMFGDFDRVGAGQP